MTIQLPVSGKRGQVRCVVAKKEKQQGVYLLMVVDFTKDVINNIYECVSYYYGPIISGRL